MTCPFSLLHVYIHGVAGTMPKNRRFFRRREKALTCFPQQRFSDLKRSAEEPIDILSAGTQKFQVVTSLAEVKYLESDDFDQNIRVHIARLVTLSVRIVARCGSLHSNPTILRYDFDILITIFRQDLARIQAHLLFEFRLYAARRRDFPFRRGT